MICRNNAAFQDTNMFVCQALDLTPRASLYFTVRLIVAISLDSILLHYLITYLSVWFIEYNLLQSYISLTIRDIQTW
jgi:hypothetical protein